jgi:hypothetical protein
VPARPGCVDQQWREPLYPAIDADVIDLDPAFGQQLLDISIRQAERKYHRTANMITSGGNRYPAKLDLDAGPRDWR